jgi:hypothetical protein
MTLHETPLREPEHRAEPLRPPTRGGISMRPAMVVLGLAVLILGVFVTIGIVTSQAPAPVHKGAGSSVVAGSALRAVPAGRVLAPIVRASAGEPPSNVVNAVSVPVGTVRVSHKDNGGGAGQFDAQVTLRSDSSQGALASFFAADMRRQGWQVFDRGPAANDPTAIEVLGKLAGTDGYYWEMGVVVAPTTFGPSSPPGGQTDLTIRLLQEGDPE